jgi:hypothetical protein
VNALIAAADIGDKFLGTNIIPDKDLILISAVANIILRFITNKPLESK